MDAQFVITDTIQSRLEIIPDFISATIEKLYYLPLDEEVIFNIKLALQEAVVNAVKHGNKLKADLSVKVELRVEGNRIIIEVTDQGQGFDPKKIPDPTKKENINKLQGRGIFLIKHLMNNVQYLNKGRTIQMIKVLKKERRAKVEIKLEKANGVVIVVLEGEVNVNNSNELRNVFIKISEGGNAKVLVDFVDVTFIDSSGLATLIEMVQRLEERDGKMRLCHVNKKIKGIFEITKIHKLIPMFDSREAALKDF